MKRVETMAVVPFSQELRHPPETARPAASPGLTGAARLRALRARVRAIELGTAAARSRSLPLGPAAVDAHLPGGGLPLGALHEIEGERAEWDDGVASGFCLAVLARLLTADGGSVLWVSRHADLYMPGLLSFGLDPARFLLVRARGAEEVVWAMEEGLRCRRLAAVVGETEGLSRQAGRRLQLAAEQSGVTAFALSRRLRPQRDTGPSAAATRWRLSAAPAAGARRAGTGAAAGNIDTPAAPLDSDVWGPPRWRLELLRCRGAAPATWLLDWPQTAKGEDDAAGDFALAAALCDGSPAARPAPPDSSCADGTRSGHERRLAG